MEDIKLIAAILAAGATTGGVKIGTGIGGVNSIEIPRQERTDDVLACYKEILEKLKEDDPAHQRHKTPGFQTHVKL